MRQGIIAAISTPPGKGGVAVIRISGEGALSILDSMFAPRSRRRLSDYPPRTAVYGDLYDGERLLDDCIAIVYRAGESYTGEETVELNIHGGILLSRLVLEALFKRGILPAERGEFTRQAFLNGRLSLTEVEAIGELIEAKSEEQLALYSSTQRARLKGAIEDIRESLVRTLASIYARIDYPEEDLGDMTDEEVLGELTLTRGRLEALVSTYRTGRAITEGIRTVLVGKPNAGKSTLYNILVGEDAAIVTDVEGTTRDLIERSIPLGRVLLSLVDTAGVREGGSDTVERIGIERTRAAVGSAELVLCLFDLSREMDDSDREVIELVRTSGAVRIAIFSKGDIDGGHIDKDEISRHFDESVTVSERDGAAAIRELGALVDKLFTDEKISASADAIVSSARQSAALNSALGHIDMAIEGVRLGMPQDATSSDIELALASIGECDGRVVTDEVTREIFSRFCVGK